MKKSRKQENMKKQVKGKGRNGKDEKKSKIEGMNISAVMLAIERRQMTGKKENRSSREEKRREEKSREEKRRKEENVVEEEKINYETFTIFCSSMFFIQMNSLCSAASIHHRIQK